jgi:hypothetical protein
MITKNDALHVRLLAPTRITGADRAPTLWQSPRVFWGSAILLESRKKHPLQPRGAHPTPHSLSTCDFDAGSLEMHDELHRDAYRLSVWINTLYRPSPRRVFQVFEMHSSSDLWTLRFTQLTRCAQNVETLLAHLEQALPSSGCQSCPNQNSLYRGLSSVGYFPRFANATSKNDGARGASRKRKNETSV